MLNRADPEHPSLQKVVSRQLCTQGFARQEACTHRGEGAPETHPHIPDRAAETGISFSRKKQRAEGRMGVRASGGSLATEVS